MDNVFGRLFPRPEDRATLYSAIALIAGLPDDARQAAIQAVDKAVNAPGQAAAVAGSAVNQVQKAVRNKSNKNKFLAGVGNAYAAAGALGPLAKNKQDRKTRKNRA